MDLDLSTLTRNDIGKLPDEAFRQALEHILRLSQADRQEMQLLYYQPTSPKAARIHLSEARKICVGGGNGSGKTENCIVKLIALATGILPLWQRDTFRKQFRGPLNTRIVLESLTTTLHPVILPKLRWWTWTGLSPLGGSQGHWGWVPKSCLVDGSWDKSWSEKLRTLTLLCHDPDDMDVILGESQLQFMSHDQDPSDFASGDFHIALHDEPPSYAIWKENEARTMRADGTMMLAMTWPDDPSIPVDWIFDELYERGIEGPKKDPNVEWIELYTTDNPHLNQESVARQMNEWSDEIRRVRIRGEPIRFSNRIHPLFTDITHTWCFKCGRTVYAEPMQRETAAGELKTVQICNVCRNEDIADMNHVGAHPPSDYWPTVFVLDPHPRKPHMFLWIQVDPKDDYWVIADGELAGEPSEVKK